MTTRIMPLTTETREKVLERDAGRCVRCGRGNLLNIHHRRLRSHPWPGLHQPSNLIVLCGSGTTGCHGYVHAHVKEAYDKGWLVHGYVDEPENVPVYYEYLNTSRRLGGV